MRPETKSLVFAWSLGALKLGSVGAYLSGFQGGWNVFRLVLGTELFVLTPFVLGTALVAAATSEDPQSEAGKAWVERRIQQTGARRLFSLAFFWVSIVLSLILAWHGHVVWAAFWVMDEMAGRWYRVLVKGCAEIHLEWLAKREAGE